MVRVVHLEHLTQDPMISAHKRDIIWAMWTRIIPALLLAISLSAQTAEESARAALNRGVAAFKNAKYTDAVSALETAVRLEPGNINARLYLATAYMVQWIPGARSPENDDVAARAAAEFRAVITSDPDNKTAVASIASLEFNQGRSVQVNDSTRPERLRHFDESEIWYRRLLQIDANDKTAYYSLGVIAWERFYPELMNARARLAMKPEDPGPLADANIRADLRNRFGRIVEDGMADLNRALAIDPNYDDAMAYLNLLYRERGDLSDSLDSYQRDVAAADSLVTRALDARKLKAEQQPQQPAQPFVALPGGGGGGGTSDGSPERIRVGGNVQKANLLYKLEPVYPPLAQQARVQGTVRFSVVIGKDGHIVNAELVSGHPLLVPASVEAVKQYVYKPTLLNGQPVEVITQVEVNFALAN